MKGGHFFIGEILFCSFLFSYKLLLTINSLQYYFKKPIYKGTNKHHNCYNIYDAIITIGLFNTKKNNCSKNSV